MKTTHDEAIESALILYSADTPDHADKVRKFVGMNPAEEYLTSVWPLDDMEVGMYYTNVNFPDR